MQALDACNTTLEQMLTCCSWLPQEAMHAEAHMLVDTSYGSLLVGVVGNAALQLAPGICSVWRLNRRLVAAQFCCFNLADNRTMTGGAGADLRLPCCAAGHDWADVRDAGGYPPRQFL